MDLVWIVQICPQKINYQYQWELWEWQDQPSLPQPREQHHHSTPIPGEGLDTRSQGKHFLFSEPCHTKDRREGKRKQAEE